MSFFKKLFKKDRRSSQAFAPRAPRIKISELHNVVFHRRSVTSIDPIALTNISTKGLGLKRTHMGDVQIGAVIKGDIEINDRRWPIEAEVRHLNESTLGCQFVGQTEAVSRAIQEYFRVEICGLQLNPVDEAYLKKDPLGRVTWFTDGRQNEIHMVCDEQRKILSFHMAFLGNYIEGGADLPVRCGHIVEDSAFGVEKHKASALVDLSDETSVEILRLATLLIDQVEKLPFDQARQLKALLTRDR